MSFYYVKYVLVYVCLHDINFFLWSYLLPRSIISLRVYRIQYLFLPFFLYLLAKMILTKETYKNLFILHLLIKAKQNKYVIISLYLTFIWKSWVHCITTFEGSKFQMFSSPLCMIWDSWMLIFLVLFDSL